MVTSVRFVVKIITIFLHWSSVLGLSSTPSQYTFFPSRSWVPGNYIEMITTQGDFDCGTSSQADSILNYFLSNFLKFPLKFSISSQPGCQAGTIKTTLSPPTHNISVMIVLLVIWWKPWKIIIIGDRGDYECLVVNIITAYSLLVLVILVVIFKNLSWSDKRLSS